MYRAPSYWRRPATRSIRVLENRYFRIAGIIIIVVTVASFYIYQRVWVRNLVEGNDQLREQNKRTGECLDALKSQWMAASSIANIETMVGELKLCLEPTRPFQNFTLVQDTIQEPTRYSGLVKAFEKLKGNLPLVSSNEADASELFDEE